MSNLSISEKCRILHLYDKFVSIRDIARDIHRDYTVVSNFLGPYKQHRGPRSVCNNQHVRQVRARQVKSPDAVRGVQVTRVNSQELRMVPEASDFGDIPVELSSVGANCRSSSVPHLVEPAISEGSDVEEMYMEISVGGVLMESTHRSWDVPRLVHHTLSDGSNVTSHNAVPEGSDVGEMSHY